MFVTFGYNVQLIASDIPGDISLIKKRYKLLIISMARLFSIIEVMRSLLFILATILFIVMYVL